MLAIPLSCAFIYIYIFFFKNMFFVMFGIL